MHTKTERNLKPKRNWVSNSKRKIRTEKESGFELILKNLWAFNTYFVLMSVLFVLHLHNKTLPPLAYPIYLLDVLFSLTMNTAYFVRYAKEAKTKKKFNSNLEW